MRNCCDVDIDVFSEMIVFILENGLSEVGVDLYHIAKILARVIVTLGLLEEHVLCVHVII